MPNDYFQFKKFLVNQGNCGMKVTTEACLFGALVSPGVKPDPVQILDIGSGTGLLSLMMAQRFSNSTIAGVELDEDAFKESSLNVGKSPWFDRIRIINCPIQEFGTNTQRKFDLIISNPPFFKKHLQPTDTKKAKAIHSDSLSPEDLAAAVNDLLADSGEFHVLLPEYESGVLQQLLNQHQILLNRTIKIFNSTKSTSVFRQINVYSYVRRNPSVTNFYMRNDQNAYTADFTKLLKPFYLHL